MRLLRITCLVALVSILSGCRSIDLGTNNVSTITPGRDAEIATTFSKSELLFSSAQKFEKAGQIQEAIKLYEKAASASVANEPGLIEANRHLAILYDLSDQPKKANQAFQVALNGKGPEDAELLNDYGYFLLKQNDFDEAARVLSIAHEKFPKNERITNNLAMALVSSGKVEDGFHLFEASVGKNDALANVGAILLQTGRITEGKNWLQQVAETSEVNNKASQMLRAANSVSSSK
ncbi:tetratricopeptide repeat protein [Mariniblastus sp.]|nr:tetratricopeptide repeat protein [Mariniblastus sp.]